ncbi:MAG: hypothetical protein H7Y42_18145 [Chitinophagaceae bacterium]|nr:hypothetical protein [Chitinophagaceae bacterium]
MKNRIAFATFLLVCAAIIGSAIYAGRNHPENCRECKLAYGKYNPVSDKFAEACPDRK